MNSHTVPQRLLRQFSYRDTVTKSLRLWRYEKGRQPYPHASPKTATRIDRYFADPADDRLEEHVETRLAREIEDPVNRFIDEFSNESFSLNETQRRQMTVYIGLLFSRCMARRAATKHTQETIAYSVRKFLSNEGQVATVATHWNLNAYFSGRRLERLITAEDVAIAAHKLAEYHQTAPAEQKSFVAQIVRSMTRFDDKMFRGQWSLLRTETRDPFILSDTPVVTWERTEAGLFSYGMGFWKPNVEVAMPISPLTCLHILPRVERTRPTLTPSVREVNTAQAAFAYRACFADQCMEQIDEIVQLHASTVQLGKNAFTIWHRIDDNAFYDILMGGPGPYS